MNPLLFSTFIPTFGHEVPSTGRTTSGFALGDGEGDAVGSGVAAGEAVAAGLAGVVTFTPLFQMSLLPLLIHVYFLPAFVAVEFNFAHLSPAFTAATA